MAEGDPIYRITTWFAKLTPYFQQYFPKRFFSILKQRWPALRHSFSRHFPAIHLKRQMDPFDYLLNFSSELIVGGLVLVVAAANIFSFGFLFHNEHDFSDGSLAGQLLEHHESLNQALYAKENSIKTTVVRSSGLVNTAYAEDSALSASSSGSDVATDPTDTGNDNVLTAPAPDTTRELLAKQVQVYQTQPGDTLASLAQRFGISQDTIKWANHLPDNNLKAGWYLKILPVSGILYQATSNDTLPDICKYFTVPNCDTVISYNNLENAEDVNAGDMLILPGGSIPAPKAAPGKPAPRATVPHGIPAGNGHSFPYGYCTWYVATKFPVKFGGNAKAWLANARAAGYATGSQAVAGSVAVTTDSRRFGHVVYVESVNGDGTMTISEMNFIGFAKVDTRRLSVHDDSVRGFIYR